MDIVNKLKKELLKQAFTEEQKQTERLNECKHIASIYAQTENAIAVLTYIIHSGFISGYQNRYGDNLKPPTNVYHRMTA